MKPYAVVKIAGKQYKISEDDKVVVDKLDPKGSEVDVLLYVDGKTVKVGKPYLKDVSVKFKVLEDKVTEKIAVFKYKAKSRYRKRFGQKSEYSRILIENITSK